MPKSTPKPSDLKSTPISIIWPETGKPTSIRGPLGLKEQITALLRAIKNTTDIHLSQSHYILNAIRYYGYYLMQATSPEELKAKLEEKHQILDPPGNEDTIEEPKEGPHEI